MGGPLRWVLAVPARETDLAPARTLNWGLDLWLLNWLRHEVIDRCPLLAGKPLELLLTKGLAWPRANPGSGVETVDLQPQGHPSRRRYLDVWSKLPQRHNLPPCRQEEAEGNDRLPVDERANRVEVFREPALMCYGQLDGRTGFLLDVVLRRAEGMSHGLRRKTRAIHLYLKCDIVTSVHCKSLHVSYPSNQSFQ